MIELVFSASPETVRKGASGVCLHRSIGRRQDLAVCALCDLDSFLLSLRFLCRGAAELSYWHEVSLLAVHCEQIGQEFACHRECGAIGIPFLFLPGVEQGEIRIVSRSQLRRLHQHMLNMFVALLGKRCAHCLVGGFLFVAAKRGAALAPPAAGRVAASGSMQFQCVSVARIESWLTRRSGRILWSMASLRASSSGMNPSRCRCCRS